ncbi:hypothetical protein ABI_29510 [Asticcacaulis biprosthecium C19]|uniref:Uncharacterized protein n=1 Tax=Asticcacaulis biprosthecium C19 TaxID=715226 RepID=F4QMU3_9CAUL|nr:hypothetical protein [Asticcacaulis biprosthecium]EGF91534.1 hypothetical protein ABI_29510 [Asticcacaulis biprosthecium C19]
MSTTRGSPLGRILVIILVIVLIIAGIWYFNKNNSTTIGEHVGEAIDAVPAAANKAIEEVKDSDTLSSVGENLEEAGENAGKGLEKAGKSTSSAVSKATDGDDRT